MNIAHAVTPSVVVNDSLIYDIGVNSGEDSRFYLEKGFSVVGVEANPLIAAELRETFSKEILEGRYILEESGIWSHAKYLTFYRNLDNDHWSSFDPGYGCRNGTAYEEIEIKCITALELFEMYGMPRYLKIDVEGADRYIVSINFILRLSEIKNGLSRQTQRKRALILTKCLMAMIQAYLALNCLVNGWTTRQREIILFGIFVTRIMST